MAYVYNQNQEEQAQQGSNIFAPAAPQQGADGGVEKIGASGTPSAGTGLPLNGEYRAGQRTAEEVNRQAQGQREARRPLKAIFERNQGDDVAQYDFGKIRSSIASAGEAAQNAANQYMTSSVSAVPTMTESDLSVITGEPPKPTPVAPTSNVPLPPNAPKNTLPVKIGSAPSAPRTGNVKSKPKTPTTPAVEPTTPVVAPKNAAPASLPKIAAPAPAIAPPPPGPSEEDTVNKIIKILTPGQASPGSFTLGDVSAPSSTEFENRFGNLGGIAGEIMRNYGSGMGRGAAAIDASMLMKTDEFQKNKQGVQQDIKELTDKRNNLLKSVPEETRVAVQKAMDDARKAADTLLRNKAGSYETSASDAKKTFENARKKFTDALAAGELTPEMEAELTKVFNQFAAGVRDADDRDYLREFMRDPNRANLFQADLDKIKYYDPNSVPSYMPPTNVSNADWAKGFSVANLPSDLTAYMGANANPYAKIKALLGEGVMPSAQFGGNLLRFDPSAGYGIQGDLQTALQMRDARQLADEQFNNFRTSLQNELALAKTVPLDQNGLMTSSQINSPIPWEASPAYFDKVNVIIDKINNSSLSDAAKNDLFTALKIPSQRIDVNAAPPVDVRTAVNQNPVANQPAPSGSGNIINTSSTDFGLPPASTQNTTMTPWGPMPTFNWDKIYGGALKF